MSIDPVALATITSAVTVLGEEYVKGLASEAGKSTWSKLKSLFGWKSDPSPADVAPDVARRLAEAPELAAQVLALLKDHREIGTAATIVVKIDAEKVVIAQEIKTNMFQM